MLARLFALLLLAPYLSILGCGDNEPEPIVYTEVRIFVEQGVVQIVEYNVTCPALEDAYGFSPEVYEPEQGNVEVWVFWEQFLPGPCTLFLRGRDDDGMTICSTEQSFTVDGPLPELEFILDCDTSPETAMW